MENEKEYEKKDLGVRMKEYESHSLDVKKIEPYRPFLVRLDGRSFSNFTGGFRKPFDLIFTKAMALTTADLISEFSAQTGYTHSDEITIIFKSLCSFEDFQKFENNKSIPKSVHIFDGRVIKLLTVMGGYCTARFNYHLIKIVNLESNISLYEKSFIEKINEMKASFDARLVIFPIDGEQEIVNHMIWRSLFDCERNAVSTYARSKFLQKDLNNKGKHEMIKMLKEKEICWDLDVPMILKHGLYLKKSNYEIEVNNEKVIRTKITGKTFKIKYNDFFYKLLLDKYWSVNSNSEEGNEIVDLEIQDLA